MKNYADYASNGGGLSIQNSLLRTKEYATTAAVVGAAQVNLVNIDPLFKATTLTGSKPDYRLQDASRATAPRRPAAGPVIPRHDLLNLPRPAQTMPSIGAYEHR